MALKLNNADVTSNKLNYTDIILETLNSEPVWDKRPPLGSPQGSLTDKFDYEDEFWHGGVMLIGLYNSNTEIVRLRGRILFGGSDYTRFFSHFSLADGYFFGDGFPPSTGLNYGLCVISKGLWTYEWGYPVTVEVWFEPTDSDSAFSASDKLIITVNS